jgi:DNA-binding MarR family transcriptional regulator
MNKKEIINQLINLEQRMNQVMIPNATDSWRELDVPLAQLKSLYIITVKGETNFSTLAQYLGVTPGDVTGIIDRLVTQGLVNRQPSPDDRRIILLHASDKGRNLINSLMESRTRYIVHILEYMSLEELKSLLKGFSALIHVLEKHQKELK